jgi:hypothetical protein
VQRYFWTCWYYDGDEKSDFYADITRMALLVAYGCVQGLLFLLFAAYKFDSSPYSGNNWFVFVVYQVLLLCLPLVVSRDGTDLKDVTAPVFSFLQAILVGLVVLANALMTIVASVDATSV